MWQGEKLRIVSVDIDKKEAKMLKSKGWSFDWSKGATELIADASILKAVLIDGEIEGLIEYEVILQESYVFAHKLEIDPHNRGENRKHDGIAGILLAFVARESFISGCDGFVVFISKTRLYDYYQNQYGAKPIGGLKLHFDTAASEKLINEYLVGKEIQYE
ncbi:MAG: hypothetical protein LBG50_01725 [Clostridiales Family XIII bacterium]|jgi:hypothetical protein|nr:hypothetical protein [Clostridiales Family XIII bacterium]